MIKTPCDSMMLAVLALGFLFVGVIECDEYQVVGLFHEENYQAEMAFKYAVARHNMYTVEFELKPIIHRIDKHDNFLVKKLVCELTSAEPGIVAIFGPESPDVSPMVQSIASNLEIPHIQTNYKPDTVYTTTTVVNLYPDPDLLSLGIATIIRNLNWKNYVILYEDFESMIRLKEVFKIPETSSPPVMIRQLSDTLDQRPLLKEIKQSTESNIVLDCATEHIMEILMQAKEIGLMEYHHSYMITSLDAHTLDFSVLQTNANITTVRLLDPNNPVLHNAVRDWELGEQNSKQNYISIATTDVPTEAALMYDAVNAFSLVFQELKNTGPITPLPLSCDGTEKWSDGFRLSTYMKVRHIMNAITGSVRFNEWGERIDFTLEVAEVLTGRVEKTAFWTPEYPNSLNFTRNIDEQMQQIVENLQKTTVIVSSRIGPPYLMYREPRYEGEILEGNARYEGYSMDLIDAVAKELNFTYKFALTADGKYGSYDKKTKSWNGLIKDLLERKAHLAICDLTITHQRREVVDFSLPFMTLGVSILYSKSKPSERNIFAFMEPLDATVWMYIVSAYLSVSLIMYLITRMAPGDWENPHPCDQSPEELENIWTFKNCLWLILGSTMSQGCDILPKGISSRMLASMWWFLILIINSSYTANLAAFLTMDKMAPTIDSAEALAKQTKIKYGTVDGGSTQTFFKESNFSTYARMWTNMVQARPSVFEKNNADGVKRVLTTKNQGYAFLMESSSLEYEVEKNCNLKQVGGRMDSKGYGIAMPVNSPYRSAINKAVLQLQEEGTLRVLKDRWWKRGGGDCESAPEEGGSSADLKLANVGGVFLVLGIGVTIAFCFSIIEFLWNVHSVSVEQKIPYNEAFKLEIKFAVKVWITQKNTNPTESETPSIKGSEEGKSKKGSLDYNSINSFSNNGKSSKKSLTSN